MHIEQRDEKSVGWLRDIYLLSPQWSRNLGQIFLSKEVSSDLRRSSYRDRKSTFSNYIFTKWYLQKKKRTGWCSWRGLKSFSWCIYSSTGNGGKAPNDTRMVEHLGPIQIGIKCFNNIHLQQWHVTMVRLYILKSNTIRGAHSVSLITRRR